MFMKKNVFFKGKKYPLIPSAISVGMEAPDFKAVNSNFLPVQLSDYGKKARIISVFPSLDTPIGTLQNKRMNAEAHIINKDIEIISISVDLPPAQTRFSLDHNLEHVRFLSDYLFHDFGKKYGFLIEEIGLLSRGLVVIDEEGIIRYIEYVEDTSEEPNYNAAISALKKLLNK